MSILVGGKTIGLRACTKARSLSVSPVRLIATILLRSLTHIGPLVVGAASSLTTTSLAGPAGAPTSRSVQEAPQISPLDAALLVKSVRRSLEAKVREDRSYEPAYVPQTLEDLICRVSVTLRRGGRLLGTADSAETKVVPACMEAASGALASAQKRRPISSNDLAIITIEIELIGPRELVGDGAVAVETLAGHYQLALEGVAVRVENRELLVRPSQLISMETFCDNDEELGHRCNRYQIAIQNLREKLGIDSDPPKLAPQTVRFYRFHTQHWSEPRSGADPVRLIGGLMLVPQESITRSEALTVADDLARYIRYRQTSEGFFSYEFLPGRDMYWPADNWVRQTATCWALAQHGSQRNNEESTQALDRALKAMTAMIQPLEGVERASYFNTPDDKNPLGATALVCLAMLDGPNPGRYAEYAGSLVRALAWMQRPDGSFRTSFPPASVESSQDYFPGEALLAIARYYTRERDCDLRAVCDRSLPYFQQYWRERRSPMFVPWQTQAWGELARSTHLQKYADFVFELSDALLTSQIGGRTGDESIFNGGFDVHGGGRAGISTAVYVEGLVDALRTARVFGDEDRAARYSESIRKACRFVVQLRFRPEEAFYVQSPQDVIGAMRDTPSDPSLRIDHNQHALAALLAAAQTAFPDQPSSP
jgi:AMMECR1 domain-containing protein